MSVSRKTIYEPELYHQWRGGGGRHLTRRVCRPPAGAQDLIIHKTSCVQIRQPTGQTLAGGGGLEFADITRRHGTEFLRQRGRTLSQDQQRVLKELACCRTAALGGHVYQCDGCGHREISYNSCRSRHCPKCQAAGAQWLDARCAELLPVDYFHVVFTLPEEIAQVAWQNKAALYELGGREQVLKYLARYTHRLAISNSRLRSIGDDNVTFQWKDWW